MLGQHPVAIDCFAGAGGLSLGLEQAGFDVRAAFDFSPQAVATYNHNLGHHATVALAQDLSARDLLELGGIKSGNVSLVAGGPPCQGFSLQRRGGDEDERNNLVFEYLRLIRELEPELFLMENVENIQGARGRGILSDLLARASEAGYYTSIKVLDAADFGVAQHRRRAFIVGERSDKPPTFSFPTRTHSSSDWKTVREAIGDLPTPSLNSDIISNHVPDNISDLNRIRISHVPEGGGREDIPEPLRLPCHRVSVAKAGHRGVYGRLTWSEPAGTITTKCNSFTRGRFAHPSEDRNITMREAARLQGFPDNFAFLGAKVPVAHQIGNAVPPPLARAVGVELIAALIRREQGIALNQLEQMVLTF